MLNFNEIAVTVYNGVTDRYGHESTLAKFLSNVDMLKIQQLRSTDDAQVRASIKRMLPQATISGLFAPTRKAENLVKPSSLLCIDIDKKDNMDYPHFDRLIDTALSKFDSVAYASRSVGGNGFFAIIPIASHFQHKQHFESLQSRFSAMGINIDRACSDICRLRCQSYDSQAYYNPSATTYTHTLDEAKRREIVKQRFANVPMGMESAGYRKSLQLCRQICSRRIDITAHYGDWITVGAALATLGESGRELFHMCSRQNPKYSPVECNRKFDNLLASSLHISLGSFFFICRRFGVYLTA